MILFELQVTEYEELLKKRDTEIRLLNQQLEEIQDEVQKSRNVSQSHRSALDIFKQKYTTAMEKVQQLQVLIQRSEEEAELSQKQVRRSQIAEECVDEMSWILFAIECTGRRIQVLM